MVKLTLWTRAIARNVADIYPLAVLLILVWLVLSKPRNIEEITKSVVACPPIYKPYHTYNASVRPLDCAAVFRGDKNEIDYGESFKWCTRDDELAPDYYITETKNCTTFAKAHGYNAYHVTAEEETFPIAFSILMHENVEQMELLLKTIYRSQNVYCVHVDCNSGSDIHKAVEAIASCFTNVIVATPCVPVFWAEFTVLEAEMKCLSHLWAHPTKWKYFINLTGREYPLKTNRELVEILKTYNGANDIDGTPHKRPIAWTEYVWKKEYWRTNKKKDPPPDRFLVHKGSTHITASRAFIRYVLFNSTAKRLLEWMKDIRVPDEHFFNTLNHNSHMNIPGSYKGDPDLKWTFSRLKVWQDDKGETKCAGRWVRFICQLGLGDIYRVQEARQLFINKLHMEMEPLAVQCMDQWYYNRTTRGQGVDFDINFYRKLDFVNNHL